MSEPVQPRHAASLIVVRQAATTPHVLMGLRGARHKFMPNRLVFPGGSVDAEDARAPVGRPLREDVRAALGRHADPALAPLLAIAAARELEEETGLSLGTPPALDGLSYLCRAITPARMPIRFDARFFAVDAAQVSGELAGSGELEDLRWYGLDEVLALGLASVTREVLLQFRRWLAAPDRWTAMVFRECRWSED